jgi:hypothetical protein
MRFVDRSRTAPPEFILRSREIGQMREEVLQAFELASASRAQARIRVKAARVGYAIWRELGDLFEGRCAFCESACDVDEKSAYPFRPDTEAEPVADHATSHLYYVWLATSWDNWFLICEGCRPDNPAHFPVRKRRSPLPSLEMLREFSLPRPDRHEPDFSQGYEPWETRRRPKGGDPLFIPSWSDLERRHGVARTEDALLLDPTRDRAIHEHLAVGPDGVLVALDPRGDATLGHFHLNRPELVERRRDAIGELEWRLLRSKAGEIDPHDLDFPGILRMRLRLLGLAMSEIQGTRLDPRDVLGSVGRMLRSDGGRSLFEELRRADPLDVLDAHPSISARRVHPPTRATPRKTARLTKVSIENFKSLERLSFPIPAEPAASVKATSDAVCGSLLILGENATGKSSILEACVLALMDDRDREALRLSPRGLILDPSFMDPDSAPGPDHAVVEIGFEDGSASRTLITPKGFDVSYEEEVPPVFAYGAFRQYLDKQLVRLPAGHHVRTLFQSDRLLPNPSNWLLDLDRDEFDEVVRALRSIFAVEGDFDVVERGEKDCFIVTPYLHGGVERRERTPLKLVSSGFRAVLAMACDIMRGLMRQPGFQTLYGARAIVFVDEIEAHLHPRWKIAIMSALREALPNVTFVVTSHDPLCLRGMGSGEVLVLNRVRGADDVDSEHPVFIESLSTLPDIEELTIEQLLTADFFQLASTDARATELEYARIADLLRDMAADGPAALDSLTERELSAFRAFASEVNGALPVGDSEIQRLVQEAVAQFLAERDVLSSERVSNLRARTRQRIVEILGRA